VILSLTGPVSGRDPHALLSRPQPRGWGRLGQGTAASPRVGGERAASPAGL